MSARSSSRSQLVERPKASSLVTVSDVGRAPRLELEAQELELDRQRRRRSPRGVDAGAVGVERRAQRRRRARASSRCATRRRPSVRIRRSSCEALRPGELGRAARRRRAGRGRAARAGPGRGRSPGRTRASCDRARARTWGTPQRSRRISIRRLEPRDAKRPLGPRQRPAKELPPERRRRRRRGERPRQAAPARPTRLQAAGVWTRPCRRASRRAPQSARSARQPALGVELLEVGLHRQRGRRPQRLGHVVPDRGQERARASARRRRAPRPAGARGRGGARGTRRSSPAGR